MAKSIDAIVIVIYLAVTFAVGLFASKFFGKKKKGESEEEDYFLGGRNIPGWLAGVSVAVTAMNADVGPTYCGLAVGVGLPVVWFYLSRFGLAYMIGSLLFAYPWRRLRVQTAPEFFSLRFGGKQGSFVRVWASNYGILTGMIPWIGAGLLGVHKIFAPVFGYESMLLTLVLTIPVMLAYVWFSGYKGVLITDFLQTAIIIAANCGAMGLVLYHFGGPTKLYTAVSDAMGARAQQALSTVPVRGNAIMGPLATVLWFFLATVGFGGNMLTEGQRILSTKTSYEAMKSFVWSALALFVMLATLTLPIMGLLPGHQELFTADPGQREQSYGILLREFLPTGMLGLALAALAAAVMSTISGHLNYGAQTFINDTVRTFRPNISDKKAIMLGRITMLVIMAASIIVYYQSSSLIGIAITVLGLFGASISFSWGQWWWWRANFPAWVSSMVIGPFIYLALGPILNRLPWWIEYGAQGPNALQLLGILHGVISLAVSTITWIIVALVTKPEEMANMKTFYLRARPMGLWKPVREAIERDGHKLPSDAPMLLPGLAIAMLGAVWLSALFVCISALYVGKWSEALMNLTIAIISGMLFKIGFKWFYQRLQKTDPDIPIAEA